MKTTQLRRRSRRKTKRIKYVDDYDSAEFESTDTEDERADEEMRNSSDITDAERRVMERQKLMKKKQKKLAREVEAQRAMEESSLPIETFLGGGWRRVRRSWSISLSGKGKATTTARGWPSPSS